MDLDGGKKIQKIRSNSWIFKIAVYVIDISSEIRKKIEKNNNFNLTFFACKYT